MPDQKPEITAPLLKKYELTDLGKKTERINLPKNRKGDRRISLETKNMTDYLAEEMLARKDERGEKYVKRKQIKTAKSSAKPS